MAAASQELQKFMYQKETFSKLVIVPTAMGI